MYNAEHIQMDCTSLCKTIGSCSSTRKHQHINQSETQNELLERCSFFFSQLKRFFFIHPTYTLIFFNNINVGALKKKTIQRHTGNRPRTLKTHLCTPSSLLVAYHLMHKHRACICNNKQTKFRSPGLPIDKCNHDTTCCSYVPISKHKRSPEDWRKILKRNDPSLECGKQNMHAARQKTEVQCLSTVTLWLRWQDKIKGCNFLTPSKPLHPRSHFPATAPSSTTAVVGKQHVHRRKKMWWNKL